MTKPAGPARTAHDDQVVQPPDNAAVVSVFACWVVRVLGTGAVTFGAALLAVVIVTLTRQDSDAGVHLTPVLRILLPIGGSALLAGAVMLALANRPPQRMRLPWL